MKHAVQSLLLGQLEVGRPVLDRPQSGQRLPGYAGYRLGEIRHPPILRVYGPGGNLHRRCVPSKSGSRHILADCGLMA